MSDDVSQLKNELQILSGRIQAERNDEVRHGLQRGRLEAERAQLLVKLMEALAAPPEVAPSPVSAEDPEKPAVRQKRKPEGLPTIQQMVLAVLDGEEDGMRPRDITAIARQKWWPDLQGAAVNAVVWKLAGEGRLEKDGHRYKLNGHADG